LIILAAIEHLKPTIIFSLRGLFMLTNITKKVESN